MISLAELKAMLKENKIRGYLHYNKSEVFDALVKRGLLPDTMNITTITSLPEREHTKKEINPKYNVLKHIRNSQKRLRSEIWKQVKLLYILLCIRLLRDLINSQDYYLHMMETYGGIDTLLKY